MSNGVRGRLGRTDKVFSALANPKVVPRFDGCGGREVRPRNRVGSLCTGCAGNVLGDVDAVA